MGKQTKTETVKEDRNPWAPTSAPLTQNIADTTRLATPGMFTPTQSASTQQGIRALETFARGPHASGTAVKTANDFMKRGAPVGLDQLIATAKGTNLQGNPYLDEMLNGVQEDMYGDINGMFSGSGRLGSGANQRLIADRVGRVTTDARMDNYNTERGYQVNAASELARGGQTYASMAPGLDAGAMMPANALLAAGGLRDAHTDAVRRAPLTALDYQRGAISPLSGIGGSSTSTQTSTMPSNLPGQILGGAMMLGSTAMGMPPGMGFGGGGYQKPSTPYASNGTFNLNQWGR